MKKIRVQYVERAIESDNWVTLLLVGCVVVLAVLKTRYPKRFNEFLKLPTSRNYFLFKGKSEELKHPFSWIMFVVQVISIALFINLFFIVEKIDSYQIFIQLLTGVFVFILIKFSIEKIISNIFSIEKIINQYTYHKLSYRNFLTLFLLFSNFLFYFSIQANKTNLLVFTGILIVLNVIILLLSYKNYRSLLFGNFFYFLLYLCTLEISPYVILYKVLV